jgi:hypothetical protein
MWVNRLGADPRVIRRRISLNRESYKIVGVMPSAFYPAPNYPELWDATLGQSSRKRRSERMGLVPIGAAEARSHLATSADGTGRHLGASLAGSPNLGIGWWDRRSMDAQFGRLATQTEYLTPEQAPSFSGRSKSRSVSGKFSVFV